MQYENDVLDRIANGEDTKDILEEKFPTIEKQFMGAVRKLAKILKDVQKEFPDAMFYTASGGLCLMLGNSHGEKHEAQQDLVALDASSIITIGDGDF